MRTSTSSVAPPSSKCPTLSQKRERMGHSRFIASLIPASRPGSLFLGKKRAFVSFPHSLLSPRVLPPATAFARVMLSSVSAPSQGLSPALLFAALRGSFFRVIEGQEGTRALPVCPWLIPSPKKSSTSDRSRRDGALRIGETTGAQSTASSSWTSLTNWLSSALGVVRLVAAERVSSLADDAPIPVVFPQARRRVRDANSIP